MLEKPSYPVGTRDSIVVGNGGYFALDSTKPRVECGYLPGPAREDLGYRLSGVGGRDYRAGLRVIDASHHDDLAWRGLLDLERGETAGQVRRPTIAGHQYSAGPIDFSSDRPGDCVHLVRSPDQTAGRSRRCPKTLTKSIVADDPHDAHYDTGMHAPEGSQAIWSRERNFHDALASQLDIDELSRPRAPNRLDDALVELAGDVQGCAVLDAGCGQGDLTLRLLDGGAAVTALDLSPGMVDVVRQRVRRTVGDCDAFSAVVAPLEDSGLASSSMDLVVGKFVLHHVDVRAGSAELQRILRPGGRAIFVENSGANPVLAFARRYLTGRFGVPRFGTIDEHPLLARDLDALRHTFSRVTARYPVFEFFVLFDRQVLRFRYARLSRLIRTLDEAVPRYVPRLRRFSYRVIVEIRA